MTLVAPGSRAAAERGRVPERSGERLGARDLYGWSETAQYTCGTDGLTLAFPQFNLVL